MTITQLGTFIKISETKNFTTAANMLGYAQSTVTTQIKQLEEELNCILFERLGKSVVLTPEGERLIIYAEKVLQLEREILLEVPAGKDKEPTGVLKLGVSESLCYNRLPHYLLEYKKKYPKMDIRLQFITHDTFPDMLKKGKLDVVYTLNPFIENNELKMLYNKPETLGFYASPTHPLIKKKSVKENDLTDVPLLLTSHNCSFRQMLVEDLNKASVTPNIALETGSKEILKQFAANELGVAFMPDMTAGDEVKSGMLKRLKWKGNDFPIFSQVFVHKDKHISVAIEELVKIIAG